MEGAKKGGIGRWALAIQLGGDFIWLQYINGRSFKT